MFRCLLILACAALLAGCAPLLETDQARLCRMALPAIEDGDAAIRILKQTAFADGRGLRVDYLAGAPGETLTPHFAECRFLAPGRPRKSQDLISVVTDRGQLSDYQLATLIRFWLATSEARANDPLPLAGAESVWSAPKSLAYGLQQAINGLPLAAIYALLAAAYSLVYGLVGRINLAFGELAAAGGYAASFGVLLAAGYAPAAMLVLALLLAISTASAFGVASGRLVFAPLHRASGQQALVATVGLSLFLQEFLRLTQGGRLHWVNPILNEPFALLRAGDFFVAATPIAFLIGAFALAAAAALLAIMKWTRFGRQWRAYADDPIAAEMFGVNPRSIFAKTFALASAFAGLSGFVMTIYYGGVGYGASTTLGLKALIAAILGGIGSIPGAFLGGLIIGAFEAAWSAYLPIDYRDVAVFSLLAVLLVLRPGGIMSINAFTPRR
ncbi:branched-chain amino acid ABC transporter permease [Methylocapsa sp. S129]|uniref:branched-chain amino acid ABC transporter permease n=1 Tax=Methylocapsa sp. S129 TaxID=1641869 RepID=UPI00131D3DB8|nr:branched-chain amino acid ABC transporter permease [Methylocapsa sp. S129]